MPEKPGSQPDEPGDVTSRAFRDLQADDSPEVPSGGSPLPVPDFDAAIDLFHGGGPGPVHGESKPVVTAAAALGGPGADQAKGPGQDSVVAAVFSEPKEVGIADALMRDEVEQRARRLNQSGISRIFERVSGGVKLGAERVSQLTNAVVSRAANVTRFGQPLSDSLDYALHHKKEMLTDAVFSAVGGGVAGGLGKTIARAALAGTGGLIATAGIGAAGGAAAGAVTEYLRQRGKIDIDKAEGALIIAGLKNEIRRIKGANKERIRNAAIRGAIIGVISGIIGAEIADNEWVQEHVLSKIRLPEIKLPEVKLPQFEGAAPAVPAAPTVEPTATPGPVAAPVPTVEVPAAAPTAVPTAEATATPTASPTAIPTEVPPPAAPAPAELPPAPPPAAPEPPAGPSRVLVPTAPTAPEVPPVAPPASELAAAPPAPSAPEPVATVPPGTEPAIGQPAVPTESVALVEPAPAELPIPAELSVVPEQIPLPADSNPWEVTSRTLRDVLGRDPTNAEILQVTKEVCRQSGISVPNWEITGEIDHRALPVDYKLVFNDPVKKLIAGMIKG